MASKDNASIERKKRILLQMKPNWITSCVVQLLNPKTHRDTQFPTTDVIFILQRPLGPPDSETVDSHPCSPRFPPLGRHFGKWRQKWVFSEDLQSNGRHKKKKKKKIISVNKFSTCKNHKNGEFITQNEEKIPPTCSQTDNQCAGAIRW